MKNKFKYKKIIYQLILLVGLVYTMTDNNNLNILSGTKLINEKRAAEFEPVITGDSIGNFFVVWTDYRNLPIYGGQGSSSDIFGQFYYPEGSPQGKNIRITDDSTFNDISFASQVFPSISMNESGQSVVVWLDSREGTIINEYEVKDIYAQCYSINEKHLGNNFRVNHNRPRVFDIPDVSVCNNGDFIIAWAEGNIGEKLDKIFVKRYNKKGIEIGDIILVTEADTRINRPRIITFSDNGFLVIWTLQAQLKGQIFNKDGIKEGETFLIGEIGCSKTSLSNFGEGFIAVWVNGNIKLRYFDRKGYPLDSKIIVNEGGKAEGFPSISVDKDSNFVVVWQDLRNEPYPVIGNIDIYAQRFNKFFKKIGKNYKISQLEIGDNWTRQYFPDVYLRNGIMSTVWIQSWIETMPGGYEIVPDSGYVYLNIRTFNDTTTHGIYIPPVRHKREIPTQLKIISIFPNPFNTNAKILFNIPNDGDVELNLYDILGQHVRTLYKKYLIKGPYIVKIKSGSISSGIYIVELRNNNLRDTQKVILLR